MSEASDAFDRAAETEARQREASATEDLQAARGGSLAGLIFFGVALVAHWLVVQRMTGWLVAHIVFVGMCRVRRTGMDRRPEGRDERNANVSRAGDARSSDVLTDREEFALPVANLGILALSLLVHWLVAGAWTFWVAVHFICLGLAAVSSDYLWSTSSPR